MSDDDEQLDLEGAHAKLRHALSLQLRSAVQYTLASGSLYGVAAGALEERLWVFAASELEDARRLATKLVALGGEPSPEIAPMRWSGSPNEALDWLIESEEETIEVLQDAISVTGREGRSEALEHRLEHLIMRKQEQVDVLIRARR
jgi:bacterioferritin (cytochrome b1)